DCGADQDDDARDHDTTTGTAPFSRPIPPATRVRYETSVARAEACQGSATRSSARMIRKNAMLAAEATMIAAQALAKRKKAASVMMNCPRTDLAPPKYSATIAPISESVALTLSAVKT